MNQQTTKDLVIKTIHESLSKIGNIPENLKVKVEYARDEKFGDYACTIAMDKLWRQWASDINAEYKNPSRFADSIIENLEKHSRFGDVFEKVEKAGPGFINLTLSSTALFSFVEMAESKSDTYGQTISTNPEKIVFEYVSANPTGPLNIVSARAAALGDSCCNLLDWAGHTVQREYYVNDYGNQVRLLGVSCFLRYLETEGAILKFSKKENDTISYPNGTGLPFPSEGYHGQYLTDVALAVVKNNPEVLPGDKIINKFIEDSKRKDLSSDYIEDQNLFSLSDDFGQAATQYFLKTHKMDLAGFRVEFHNFFSEKSLHDSGKVLEAQNALGEYVYEDEGKVFFKSTEFGDDKDRVIIRDDGRPTYLLADIAYHKNKIERNVDRVYNIWGPDHHGYIKRLSGAIQAMGYPEDKFRVLIAQQVNLLEDGKPVVMSKRTGKFITMDTLIEEIPVDVSRYFFVMRSFEAHLDFDFTEARDTSEKNPYYYIAYAHARICSIFDRAKELGLEKAAKIDFDDSKNDFEMTQERRRLFWLVSRFPEEIRDAAENLEPHRVITYLYQIATAFSRFYGHKENRIIEQDKITAGNLLLLLDSVAICLRNGLHVLGMEAPQRLLRDDTE